MGPAEAVTVGPLNNVTATYRKAARASRRFRHAGSGKDPGNPPEEENRFTAGIVKWFSAK
jgi:hypothetical protein